MTERARALSPAPPRRLPRRPRAALQRALADADVRVEPEEAVSLWLVATVAVAVPAQALAGLGGPSLLCSPLAAVAALRLGRGRADRRARQALPGVLEGAAAWLRGGGTVADAVGAAGDGDGPLAADLARVRARAALGVSLADALEVWPAERAVPDVRAAAGALALAATLGGRAADALDGLARSVRDRIGAAAEARALSTQARLSAIVVGVAPLAYLVPASAADPATLHVLTGTGPGRVCLALGLGLDAAALAWIRRIVREDG